ncbi:MAG: MoaD/ThiS family protein [Pirellulaceae bacterium]|nr:MoaD/ThiS family protein [Pirellulaceae bacterium]
MTRIEFTPQLAQHVQCKGSDVSATTLREAFDAVFDQNPRARGYILDDQGSVRKHVAIFINNQLLHDRDNLDVPLSDDCKIYIMQALSGG